MNRPYEYVRTLEAIISTDDMIAVAELTKITEVKATKKSDGSVIKCVITGDNKILIQESSLSEILIEVKVKGS